MDEARHDLAAFKGHGPVGLAVGMKETHRTGAGLGVRAPEAASDRGVSRKGLGLGTGDVAGHRPADGKARQQHPVALEAKAGGGIIGDGGQEGSLVPGRGAVGVKIPGPPITIVARLAIGGDHRVATTQHQADHRLVADGAQPLAAIAVQKEDRRDRPCHALG